MSELVSKSDDRIARLCVFLTIQKPRLCDKICFMRSQTAKTTPILCEIDDFFGDFAEYRAFFSFRRINAAYNNLKVGPVIIQKGFPNLSLAKI